MDETLSRRKPVNNDPPQFSRYVSEIRLQSRTGVLMDPLDLFNRLRNSDLPEDTYKELLLQQYRIALNRRNESWIAKAKQLTEIFRKPLYRWAQDTLLCSKNGSHSRNSQDKLSEKEEQFAGQRKQHDAQLSSFEAENSCGSDSSWPLGAETFQQTQMRDSQDFTQRQVSSNYQIGHDGYGSMGVQHDASGYTGKPVSSNYQMGQKRYGSDASWNTDEVRGHQQVQHVPDFQGPRKSDYPIDNTSQSSEMSWTLDRHGMQRNAAGLTQSTDSLNYPLKRGGYASNSKFTQSQDRIQHGGMQRSQGSDLSRTVSGNEIDEVQMEDVPDFDRTRGNSNVENRQNVLAQQTVQDGTNFSNLHRFQPMVQSNYVPNNAIPVWGQGVGLQTQANSLSNKFNNFISSTDNAYNTASQYHPPQGLPFSRTDGNYTSNMYIDSDKVMDIGQGSVNKGGNQSLHHNYGYQGGEGYGGYHSFGNAFDNDRSYSAGVMNDVGQQYGDWGQQHTGNVYPWSDESQYQQYTESFNRKDNRLSSIAPNTSYSGPSRSREGDRTFHKIAETRNNNQGGTGGRQSRSNKSNRLVKRVRAKGENNSRNEGMLDKPSRGTLTIEMPRNSTSLEERDVSRKLVKLNQPDPTEDNFYIDWAEISDDVDYTNATSNRNESELIIEEPEDIRDGEIGSQNWADRSRDRNYLDYHENPDDEMGMSRMDNAKESDYFDSYMYGVSRDLDPLNNTNFSTSRTKQIKSEGIITTMRQYEDISRVSAGLDNERHRPARCRDVHNPIRPLEEMNKNRSNIGKQLTTSGNKRSNDGVDFSSRKRARISPESNRGKEKSDMSLSRSLGDISNKRREDATSRRTERTGNSREGSMTYRKESSLVEVNRSSIRHASSGVCDRQVVNVVKSSITYSPNASSKTIDPNKNQVGANATGTKRLSGKRRRERKRRMKLRLALARSSVGQGVLPRRDVKQAQGCVTPANNGLEKKSATPTLITPNDETKKSNLQVVEQNSRKRVASWSIDTNTQQRRLEKRMKRARNRQQAPCLVCGAISHNPIRHMDIHLPRILQNMLFTNNFTKPVSSAIVKVLVYLKQKIIGTDKTTLLNLRHLIDDQELINQSLKNQNVSQDYAAAMKQICVYENWTIPKQFTIVPLNSSASLIHWKSLEACLTLLRTNQIKEFIDYSNCETSHLLPLLVARPRDKVAATNQPTNNSQKKGTSENKNMAIVARDIKPPPVKKVEKSHNVPAQSKKREDIVNAQKSIASVSKNDTERTVEKTTKNSQEKNSKNAVKKTTSTIENNTELTSKKDKVSTKEKTSKSAVKEPTSTIKNNTELTSKKDKVSTKEKKSKGAVKEPTSSIENSTKLTSKKDKVSTKKKKSKSAVKEPTSSIENNTNLTSKKDKVATKESSSNKKSSNLEKSGKKTSEKKNAKEKETKVDSDKKTGGKLDKVPIVLEMEIPDDCKVPVSVDVYETGRRNKLGNVPIVVEMETIIESDTPITSTIQTPDNNNDGISLKNTDSTHAIRTEGRISENAEAKFNNSDSIVETELNLSSTKETVTEKEKLPITNIDMNPVKIVTETPLKSTLGTTDIAQKATHETTQNIMFNNTPVDVKKETNSESTKTTVNDTEKNTSAKLGQLSEVVENPLEEETKSELEKVPASGKMETIIESTKQTVKDLENNSEDMSSKVPGSLELGTDQESTIIMDAKTEFNSAPIVVEMETNLDPTNTPANDNVKNRRVKINKVPLVIEMETGDLTSTKGLVSDTAGIIQPPKITESDFKPVVIQADVNDQSKHNQLKAGSVETSPNKQAEVEDIPQMQNEVEMNTGTLAMDTVSSKDIPSVSLQVIDSASIHKVEQTSENKKKSGKSKCYVEIEFGTDGNLPDSKTEDDKVVTIPNANLIEKEKSINSNIMEGQTSQTKTEANTQGSTESMNKTETPIVRYSDPRSYPRKLISNTMYAIGVNPIHAAELEMEQFERLLLNKATKALGVVGLDWTAPEITWQCQEAVFKQVLECCNARKALLLTLKGQGKECSPYDKALDIVQEFCGSNQSILLDEFSGDDGVVKTWLGQFRNCYFGLSQNVLDSSSHDLSVLKSIPLDRIILECSSPNLQQEGCDVSDAAEGEVVKTVANVYGVSMEEIRRVTNENRRRLYHI